LRLLQCKGDPAEFFSTRSGKQRPEWKHIPAELKLKRGALVMVLANRRVSGGSTAFEYVNGDLGILESWRKGAYGWDGQNWGDLATVRLARNDDLVEVWPVSRVVVDHDGSKNPPVMGSITYLPLKLAYATTAHKSQGLSLDKVQIALHSHFWTTPGMLYVACSRARTLEGLRIVGHPTQFLQRCTVNPKVREWIK
jgi:ATP-dependent exoDNAse (exonuclease V) alpha subunit